MKKILTLLLTATTLCAFAQTGQVKHAKPLSYARYEFSVTGDDAQKNFIKEKLQAMYERLEKESHLEGFHNYLEIQKINETWLKKNALLSYEWFAELKEKESFYLNKIQKYNEENGDLDKLKNEREILSIEIQHITNKIAAANTSRQKVISFLENDLKEELQSKLATIPKSIVLVGRIAASSINAEGDELRKKLIEALDERMKFVAVEKIKGYKITAHTLSNNQQLKQLFEKTSEGRSQTKDTYYKDLYKTIRGNGKLTKYLYLILRIEVFIYEKATELNKNKQQNGSGTSGNFTENTQIFRVLLDTKQLEDIYSSQKTAYGEHKFAPDLERYLKFQTEFTKELNELYSKKIDEAVTSFEQKVKNYEAKQNKLKQRIELLQEEKLKKEDELRVLNKKINEPADLESLKTAYELAQKEYANYYQVKEAWVNKLVIQDSELSFANFNVQFKEMVEKSYTVVQDMKKNQTRISVYKEVSGDESSLTYDKNSLSMSPKAVGFNILSMDIYSPPNQPDKSYLALNIAYKINWNVTKQDQALANPVLLKLQADGSLKDESNNLTWKFFKENPTSYSAYAYEPEGGNWRLPAIKELKSFLKAVKKQKQSGNDVLSTFEWPDWTGQIFILSNNSHTNDYNERKHECYSVNKNNYEFAPADLDSGDEVWILLVK